MIDDKIKKWVDDSLEQSYSIEQIKQNLNNFGYSKEDIDILVKDKKEVQKNIVAELNNPKIFNNIKDKFLNYYVLIPTIIILIAIISISVFLALGNKSQEYSSCTPIFIKLENACKLNDKIILTIKNEGISFSEFNYYVNNKIANKEVYIFDPEKTTKFSIKLPLFETKEAKQKFPKVNSIKIIPISNDLECASKSITIAEIKNC